MVLTGPLGTKDIAPWYSHVEKFIGVSGEALNLPQLPDSEFLPPMELNCLEEHLKYTLSENYKDPVMTIGRVAHITQKGINKEQEGRPVNTAIDAQRLPFWSYFSSNSSTLPYAEATGNLTLRPDSIVSEVIYDPKTQKASGVRVIDALTKEVIEFKSKIVFLCASAMASSAILMQSKAIVSLMEWEMIRVNWGTTSWTTNWEVVPVEDMMVLKIVTIRAEGPTDFTFPVSETWALIQKVDFLRGYGYQGGTSRGDWSQAITEHSYGKSLKKKSSKPETGGSEWEDLARYSPIPKIK